MKVSKIYLVSWDFIKWLFKCFEINKLKNLKQTISRFWPGPGSYLYYSDNNDINIFLSLENSCTFLFDKEKI